MKASPSERLGWIGYASIARAIQVRPCTAHEVAESVGFSLVSVRRVLLRLAEMGEAHQSGWVKPKQHGSSVALWSLGAGEDVPRPDGAPGRPRKKESRRNAMPEVMQIVSMMRILSSEPVHKKQLAELCGSAQPNVCRVVNHMHRIGLVHIAEYDRRLNGGAPIPLFLFGPGTDAKRPARESVKHVQSRFREKRRALAQMKEMIHMTAASNSSQAQEAA